MNKEKVKAILERTPFLDYWRAIRKKAENNKLLHINLKYQKAIKPFIDNPEFLQEKMRELDTKAKEDKKIFYIIGQRNSKVGMYGYINCFLPHIAYAVSKGLIPVIDMQNYDNIYLAKDKGTYNAWESFYEQPMGVGLEDLKNGQVIKCPDELWYRWAPNSCPMMSDKEIAMWGTIYNRYIRYNKISGQYVENEQKNILKNPSNTLGVIYRGSTYSRGHAIGHPIQPTMKMLAEKIEEILAQNNIDKIYLASDEKSVVDYMNKKFPKKVLINKRVYYDEVKDVDYSKYNIDGTDITGDLFDRENNQYLIGIEYISSMNIVSKCNYLIAGACGGTTAVLYMNNMKYKDRYVFDLGKYGFDSIPND